MKTFARLLSLVALLVFNSGSSALACAACYGDTSGSKQGTAAAVGIFAMVILMFVMLGAVAGFGFYLNYRAKHPLPDYQDLLDNENSGTGPST